MHSRMHIAPVVVVGLAVILLCGIALGGPTGTLTGKVTDLQTGEPLPGANVVLVGSGRGGVTNAMGEYTVTGITAGEYPIRVSLLGYQTIETKRTTIDADKTTVFNFRLASTDIELEGVTVEGRPPIVDVRKTSGDQTFNRDKIENLPNVKGVEDVLGLQAGVVRFGNQLFLRGGRANETQILVDGVPVNDQSGSAAANQELQQLYAGNATGGGALSVSAASIQSVSVSAGGLDGEFGNAQSGVVSITTKTGGDRYSASAEYRTDSPTENSFNERYYSFSFGGPEPLTSSLLPMFGAAIPGKITFFMNASFNQEDGANPFNTGQFYTPLKRRVRVGGIFGGLLDGLGFTYTDRQSNNFNFFSKFTWLAGESDIVTYTYRANASSSHPLSGAFSYLNRADSSTTSSRDETQNVVQWTHLFSRETQVSGFISYQQRGSKTQVADLEPPDYAPQSADPNGDGFVDLGNSQRWYRGESDTWSAKVKLESQVHEYHRLKTGFEIFFEGVRSTDIRTPTATNRNPDPNQRGEYPGYGFARWVTNNYPTRGALWAQDDISLGTLNIKLILRYDFVYLGKQILQPDYVSRWETITREKATWLDKSSFGDALTRGYFSPRLGIGYPISTETVFYFNYNHYLQFPEWDQYWHDPVSTTLSGNYVGNPSLKPQKTISYEAGFDQQIFTQLSLGVRGYYKDVFDYASFRRLQVTPVVDKYVNLDYASTRGFEIILRKDRIDDYFFGSINYTFQLAKGRSSDPRAAQNSPGLFGLPREVRLDYDQQHTLSVYLGYTVGPRDEFSLFGLNINNWTFSFAWNYGSGFPFTPYSRGTLLSDLYLINTGDGPYTSQIDMGISKGFQFFNSLSLTVRFDVKNLLDRRNVDLNAGGFNTLTGRVLQYGDYTPDTRVIYSWYGNGTSWEARVPPFVFQPPRHIVFGFKVSWE